ncbi:MAG: hypothetical protein ACRERD_13105, partial [Candidatus Binatia bacterium]
MDNAILSTEKGLPLESVERSIAFQQAFTEYADKLLARFPDQISVVWVEPVPNTRGHIQFTGEVPPEVAVEIRSLGLLDSSSVVLTGGGMISMADHARRAELAAEAMVELGYRNLLTLFDPVSQVIRIELKLPEGATLPSRSDIVAAVQEHMHAA